MSTMVKGSSGHYASRPDGRVYYQKVGHGDAVVLLHNLELSGFIWRRTLDKLAAHFTCYNVDMPGHDRSDIPPRKYSIDDYAKSIVDVMDAAGIRKANFVACHGGSVVTLALAGKYPERVNKLVFDGLPFWNLERGRVMWERFWLPTLTDTTYSDISVQPLKVWEEEEKQAPWVDREHFEETQRIARRSRRWIRLSFEAIAEYDIEAAASRVQAPTLLVNGEQDPLRRGEQRALGTIKGAILKIVPGCRWPHWHKPDEFAALALEFLLNGRDA